jgi:hypothetical protein
MVSYVINPFTGQLDAINSTSAAAPLSPASGGTGVASPAAHTLPVAEGAAPFNFLGPLTNGQLLIGSTGADPVPAVITPGAGISVTNAAGSITIAATGGTGTVTSVSGTANQVAVANPTTTPVISLIGPYAPTTYPAHSVIVGEGTASMAGVGPGAANTIFVGEGATTDPAFLAIAASQLAATNAAGTLASRAFIVNNQVFTSSGTYTPTTGMLYVEVRCIGGGGGGGGAPTTTAGQFSVGAGGGAGEFSIGKFSAATIGASQVVTIGAAGAANAGAAGGVGGTTSLGALITSLGGSGGSSSAAGTDNTSLGGLGGTGGAGGDFRCPGNPGTYATLLFPSLCNPGYGGSSIFGAGGNALPTQTGAGSAGLGNGTGGGGASNSLSTAATAGGAGAKGIVFITEYIIN